MQFYHPILLWYMYLILCFKARDKEAFISLSWAQAFFELISLTYYTSAWRTHVCLPFTKKQQRKIPILGFFPYSAQTHSKAKMTVS